MRKSSISIALLLILALSVFTSCARIGKMEEVEKTIPLDNAQSVDVSLRMSAGELRLEGGAAALMEGRFRTNVEHWKPDVSYNLFGSRGTLTIEQPRHEGIHWGRAENKWDVRLNDKVPVSIKAKFGAGEASLILGTLNIQDLELKMGVGDLTLDLAGYSQKGFSGRLKGGIGSATIYLPEKAGVRVSVNGGLGSVDAQGFSVNHHVYTNDAYGKSEVTIDLKVEAGIGSLDLRIR
jgi:hypothetical protein